MSVIHSALKKAEAERQQRLEPYNLSIDAIVELARLGEAGRAKQASGGGLSAPAQKKQQPLPRTVPVIQVGRKQKSNSALKKFVLIAAAVALAWLIFSVTKQMFYRKPHEAPAPVKVAQKADGLRPRKSLERDALQQPVAAAPAGVFSITGVVSSGGQWNAMINNKLVSVGSVINGARVVSIYEGAATLEMNGKKFTIYLD